MDSKYPTAYWCDCSYPGWGEPPKIDYNHAAGCRRIIKRGKVVPLSAVVIERVENGEWDIDDGALTRALFPRPSEPFAITFRAGLDALEEGEKP